MNNLIKVLVALIIIALLASCGASNYGFRYRKYHMAKPCGLYPKPIKFR